MIGRAPVLYDAGLIISETDVGRGQEIEMKHPQIPVENLRSRRKALGLTQSTIAERSGVSRTTLSLIDRGLPVSVATARAVEVVMQEAEKG